MSLYHFHKPGACRGQKRASDSLRAVVTDHVSPHAAGTEPGSSGETASALNC